MLLLLSWIGKRFVCCLYASTFPLKAVASFAHVSLYVNNSIFGKCVWDAQDYKRSYSTSKSKQLKHKGKKSVG